LKPGNSTRPPKSTTIAPGGAAAVTSASDPTATIESPCTATAAAADCSGSMVRIVPPRNTTPRTPVGVGSALGVVVFVGAFVVGAQESITAPVAMAAAPPRSCRREIRSSKVIHPSTSERLRVTAREPLSRMESSECYCPVGAKRRPNLYVNVNV
jgi:hypothetical protein